jgi:hypothetical protein
MGLAALHCYQCETGYGYIGREVHPAMCPACGSPCVAPAGRLTVRDRTVWRTTSGVPRVWIAAVDERDRPFEFEVEVHGERGRVVALKIDGIRVDPGADESLGELPPAVREEFAERGVTQFNAAAVSRS